MPLQRGKKQNNKKKKQENLTLGGMGTPQIMSLSPVILREAQPGTGYSLIASSMQARR